MSKYGKMLPALALAGVLFAAPQAWAQNATNLNCKKCVDTGDIAKNAVEKKQLGKNAVNSSKIADGQVKNADLADSAVNGAKIEDGAVELVDLSPAVQQVTDDLSIDVAGLEARLAAAEGTIATLQNQLTLAQAVVTALEGRLTTAENDIVALLMGFPSPSALVDFVRDLNDIITIDEVPTDLNGDGDALDTNIDLDGDSIPDVPDELLPRVLFEGVNVQVVNGEGATDSLNALGNLIVGYDEERTIGFFVCSDGAADNQMDCEDEGHYWARSHKNGSHNLVVGPEHSYSRTGGVVFGELSTVNRTNATVTGGRANIASGEASSVSGGVENLASGLWSSVSGGSQGIASADFTSVSGGDGNVASLLASSVSGGRNNEASGAYSSVSAGDGNVASGDNSSVSGGNDHNIMGNCNWGGEDNAGMTIEFGNGLC